MENTPLLSVIVPVYNVEAYVARCVESILNQTYKNLEVILVDDGATDASGAICDTFAAQDPRVRVIHKENGGLSSARNAGLETATGEYITFVDSDDWIEGDALEKLLAAALEHQVELVVGGRYDVDGKTGEKRLGLCPRRQEVISGEELVGRIFLWDNCDSSACDKLFARRLFREVRFPMGKVCEDVPVMYRIVLDAGRAALLDKPVYNYFHRPGSISNSTLSEKTFHFSQHTAEIYPYIKKHHPAIEPQARFLRVRGLVYSVQSLDLASIEDRRNFRAEGKTSRRELRKHLPFVWKYPAFSRRKRIENTMMAFGLYRIFRQVYHKIR